MKKIIVLLLVAFGVMYANTLKECLVWTEWEIDKEWVKNNPPKEKSFEESLKFLDVNKSITACTQAVKDSPDEPQYSYQLAEAYEQAKDSKNTFKWYKKAAEQNSTGAQYDLGKMYYYGDGIKKDYKKAFKWYMKAAEKGYSKAQFNLANLYHTGKGTKKNQKESIKWLLEAAKQGFASAQGVMGMLYRDGDEGLKQDYKKAFKWLMKAAEQGNIPAQNNIGNMYYEGQGVKKDYKKAFKCYMKAADEGYSKAQYSIGWMYANGEWATRNHKKAFNWYLKAAEQGHVDAMVEVADRYYFGFNGKERNKSESFKWYLKAAKLGNARAQSSVGNAYNDGDGVRKNYKKALQWYLKAAKQNDLFSPMYVGKMYALGKGTKVDFINAYAWLSIDLNNFRDVIAKTKDDYLKKDVKNIEDYLKELESRMTPEQIDIAQDYNPLKENTEAENKPNTKQIKSSRVYTGTGFFVDRSTVLTNNHVVKNCTSIELVRNGYKSGAKIKAKDSINDLAILEADTINSSSMNFRAGKGIRIGDDIIVIGYPMGDLLGSGIKLTTGNVSALTGINNDTTSMQLTAPVQPGNSGGALLDKSGNVVGVVVARLKKGQNVNFAIKSNVAQMFLDINNIDYGVAMSKDKKDVADIADEAKESIVQVVCHE